MCLYTVHRIVVLCPQKKSMLTGSVTRVVWLAMWGVVGTMGDVICCYHSDENTFTFRMRDMGNL